MTLPRSAPSARGVDAAGVLRLVDSLDAHPGDFHSLMIARHGHVIAEGWWAPYAADRVHRLYSLSKSFTAAVVGQLVAEGVLDLDAPVWSYLTDDLAGLAPRWRRVRVRHCLTMTVGHRKEAWSDWAWDAFDEAFHSREDPFLGKIRGLVPDGEPGEVWAYNQVATYLLAQAVERATGRRLSSHVRERLLGPFGVPLLKAERTPQGHDLGYVGLHVPTEAVLALAQTHLDGGVFLGRRLLSEAWVAEARTPTSASLADSGGRGGDWAHGYGFSFWGSSHGYRGDGAFGQYALVLPELDLTVAITSEHDMQHTLDLVWEHLLPACGAPGTASADAALAARLAGLAVPARTGEVRAGTWSLGDGEAGPGAVVGLTRLTLVGGQGRSELVCGELGRLPIGAGEWLEGRLTYPVGELPVVASGGWNGDVFTAELRLIETPHSATLRVSDGGARCRLTWRQQPLTGPDPGALVSTP